MTSPTDPENAPSTDLVLTPKVALVVATCVPALFFLLDDLLGLINGGGLFSIWSAFHAASEHAAVINVDSAGLRTLFLLLCSIAVIVPSSILRANLTNRLVAFVVIVPIIGGGGQAAIQQAISAAGTIPPPRHGPPRPGRK